MIIPWQQISDSALHGIIEEFVLREGTDYGHSEASFEDKKADIIRQLQSGDIVVVYSELHETVNLMQADTFNRDASHAG